MVPNIFKTFFSSSKKPSNFCVEKFTFKNPRRQFFDLPYPIMKYILQNPTGSAWKKLIQTCKFFFSKNPVYPVFRMDFFGDSKWKADGEIIDSKETIVKLWIYGELLADKGYKFPNALSSIISKIYKCDLQYLILQDQKITWNEYQILTSSGTITACRFWQNTIIKYSNGTVVTCDKLLENLEHLRYLEMNCFNNDSMFIKDTVKNIAQILRRFKNLKHCEFYNLPESFDITSFIDFLKNNKTIKGVYLRYTYDTELSDAYKKILEDFVDKIIEISPKYFPYIEYPGFKNARYLQLYKEFRKLF